MPGKDYKYSYAVLLLNLCPFVQRHFVSRSSLSCLLLISYVHVNAGIFLIGSITKIIRNAIVNKQEGD